MGLRRTAGFSIVELMVAITIGLFLMSGLTLIFVNSSEANRELQKTAQQIENGRYAIQIISQDLHVAGYYGHLHEMPVSPASLPDPCEIASTTNLAAAIAYPVQGYRAADLATKPDVTATTCDDKGLLTAANLKAGSDVLVVRRANTTALTAADVAATNEVYLQAGGTASEITFGNGAALGTNKPDGNASTLFLANGTTPAPVRKYHVHVYFIAPCSFGSGTNGVCATGDDTVPTLKRLELLAEGGTTKMKLVPLVEGVEYLKIEYAIDNLPAALNPTTGLAGDAQIDSYSATPADWTTVVGANVYVLARNTEATTGYSDTKSYTLGGVTVAAATSPNDRFKRHVYSAEVRMVNPAGRREIP
jgi:type IV pilus assembly protein PilW